MTFVNSYDSHHRSRLSKLVRLAPADGGMLALGDFVQGGLAVRIDPAGQVAWSRQYQQGLPMRFIDGVAAENGFLLLGATGAPAPKAGEDVLIRIDGSGNLLWSRRIPNRGIGALRVVRAVDGAEEFVLLARPPRDGKFNRNAVSRLVRIGSNGALLAAVELADDAGGRLLDIAAVPGGYVLVGDGGDSRTPASWAAMEGEAEVSGRYGMIVEIDRTLGVRSSARIPPPPGRAGLSVRLAAVPSKQRLIVAGILPGQVDQQVFVAELRRGGGAPALVDFAAFMPWAARERPIAMDMAGEELALLIHPDGTGANGTVARIGWSAGASFAPTGNHRAAGNFNAIISDLRTTAAKRVALVSTVKEAPNHSFIAGLDPSLACCTMEEIDPRKLDRPPVKLSPWPLRAYPIDYPSVGIEPDSAPVAVAVKPICGVAIDWGEERMVQSPHLNLQASGCDGSDASRGVLLRWFLTGALEGHLAKGDHATGTLGFNKPDDHVHLYRAEWPEPAPIRRLDLAVDLPVSVDHNKRSIYFERGSGPDRDRFVLRFDSFAGYSSARQSKDPMTDPAGFVAAYGDRLIEVELHDRLAVACDLEFSANAGGTIRIETLSAADTKQLTPRQVSSRRQLGAVDGPVKRLIAENLRGLRFRCTSARVQSFAFICYDDLLDKVNAAEGWFPLGRFALTLDDQTAFERLEDPARFHVDGHWRKYHGGARVRVKNYRDRWLGTPDGLRAGVQAYIQLSDSDPEAGADVPGPTPGDGTIRISYRDMIEALAIADFQVARMLGQGHVDDAVDDGRRYLHLAAYDSLADLGDGRGARPVRHLYADLPTALADSRPPMTPELDPVLYGLSVPQGSGAPHQLTDSAGYTAECNARYIRLYPGCVRLYAKDTAFWTPSDLFDLSAASLPVLYGIEYRKQGESGWRDPKIAHDPVYKDGQTPAQPEIWATPFPAERYERAFVHRLADPDGTGIHEYAAFSINIWSRASPLSPTVATDLTLFRRRNTLLPPSDLLVQFIEPEAPLILTTLWEQQELGDFAAGDDRSFVRLCCNYGFIQDLAYGFADTIEIFHRRETPRNVKGALKAAAPDFATGGLRIETKSCTYASTGETFAPDLPQALKQNFVGGSLTVGTARFAIEDIAWPGADGADPIFIVRKPTTSGVIVNDLGQNVLVTQDAPLDLHPGDLVMATENMTEAASWGGGNPLVTTISIGDSSWQTKVETFVRADGTTASRTLRGIWATAEVAATATAGRYEIKFDSYKLNPHPQSGDPDPVNWWLGQVRVPLDSAGTKERRSLNVVGIGADGAGHLVLIATDDKGGLDPVLAAPSLMVNYYPGYKVYLHAQHDFANPVLGFDWPRLTPAPGEGSRTTILAVRSRDSGTLDTSGHAYRSAVGPQQQIVAREIRDPLPPLQPLGLLYATQPDTYHLSSYTMTVGFDHEPFSVAFYRAPALSILESLYEAETSLPAVCAAIFPPDSFFANRFADLFAFMAETDTRSAMDSIALDAGGTYAMPLPDNPDLGLTGQTGDDKAKIRSAVHHAFTPLTALPLVYAQISTAPGFVPTNRPQRIYDSNGEFLPAADMDLAPMAWRPDSGHSVRFTDFTLDGAMSPDMLFFYRACEISENMQMSEPGPISKPVKLINFASPAPPKMRRMTITPFDPATAANPTVEFELIEPAQADPIARLQLFRATEPAAALSVRTMELIQDVDLATAPRTADNCLLVADHFTEDPFIPYGDTLSYRLAWIREVHYQDPDGTAKVAEVPSEPSRSFTAELIDVVNPEPPLPSVAVTAATASDERIVHLSWSPTVHNGTYYLTRLSASGTWTRLGEVATNVAATFILPDPLPVADEDGTPLFYRFAIDVRGSGGLVNSARAPVTVRLDLLQPPNP